MARTTLRESADPVKLIEDFFELPLQEQLVALRTIAPKMLSSLRGEDRDGFLRELDEELWRVSPHEPL